MPQQLRERSCGKTAGWLALQKGFGKLVLGLRKKLATLAVCCCQSSELSLGQHWQKSKQTGKSKSFLLLLFSVPSVLAVYRTQQNSSEQRGDGICRTSGGESQRKVFLRLGNNGLITGTFKLSRTFT